jgi:hypothetical protein
VDSIKLKSGQYKVEKWTPAVEKIFDGGNILEK